ncbi:Protein chibby 1 [Clonorchis sinensis]|uniref:Protein chibby homolog 1 n=2 Tax=Clonorchis sinensis TaxID=79923 RepID=G7Y5F4_CLOSI|nr:Protein chibby 1 [Clonorchis sinensis]GAA48190.1 protein chibby homolog 1 [Clonorchis sinensis]
MPLFAKRFSVPKFPSRKAASMTNLSQLDSVTRSQEFGLDFGPIRTRLSGRNLVFREGNWIVEGGDTQNVAKLDRESFRIKKENHQLVEENNLLKLKIDILLDMLAETTAEVHLQGNEIENLRTMLNKKPQTDPIQVS